MWKINKSVLICAAGICVICVPFYTTAQTAEKNYGIYCGVCHGMNMEAGKPNSLIKKDWKYGGSKEALIKTITNGIANTQMIAWEGVIKPEEIEELAAFILASQPKTKKKK
ncbi:c-type cytochrome [Jiulongibacter sp. NS-SX5]|uniref:c-type cytochrome n=1 Tax=Jiulongibacter sp. NS-SX5 TaxID=3463854 RepID=UPI004058855C